MADILECPHCHGRIIPTAANLCPGCGKDVADLAEIRKSEIRDIIWNRIVAEQRKGRRFIALQSEMTGWPFPRGEIEMVQQEYEQHLAIFRHETVMRLVLPGTGALLLGIGITACFLFGPLGFGGVHIVADGLMFYGLLSLMVGLMRWHRAC